MNLNLQELDMNPIFKRINYRDLIIFLMPLMLFTLYLFIYNPGILTVDSFNQLHQIATGHFTNWHPFFYTFIEMLCLKIYGSPASVGVFQILIFCIMWTSICKYHRDDTAENSNMFVLQFILTLIICLIPINAVYSITLWKDILFSYCLVFLCFLIKVMIDKNGQIDYKLAIGMALMMACVVQLRVNGIYIILPTLIILAVYLFKKSRTQKMHIILPALTILFILLIASLNVIYDVEDAQKDAVLAKTSHMLADYDLNLNLDDADRDKIHKLMNETKIKESYTPYYSDPIYWITNQKAFNDDKGTYIAMAIKYSLSNPLHFAKYMLKSSAIVWDITRDSNWKGQPYYIYEDGAHLENAKDIYYNSINETPKEGFENVHSVNLGNSKYNLINSIVNAARTNHLLDTLFNSAALYMYLAIALLVLIQFITKSKETYLIYIPIALNIIVVFLSIPVQDTRYLYSNLLAFYLIMIIFINVWLTLDHKPQAISSAKNRFANQKNEAKPDFREENAYVYDDLEDELEHLTIKDINDMLGEESENAQKGNPKEKQESDLIDNILKEIETGKQNK